MAKLNQLILCAFTYFMVSGCSGISMSGASDKQENQLKGLLLVMTATPLRSFSVPTNNLSSEPLNYNIIEKTLTLNGLNDEACEHLKKNNVICTNGTMSYKPRSPHRTHEKLLSLFYKKQAMIALSNNDRTRYNRLIKFFKT
jgi:hypothetical protein